MQIELQEIDAGFRRLKKPPKPADFNVSHVEYFYSTPEGMVQVSNQSYDMAKPFYEVAVCDQWLLMVDGFQWGYVSKKNNGHVFLIRRVSDEVKQQLLHHVSQKVGDRVSVLMPCELPKEDEDEEEDLESYGD